MNLNILSKKKLIFPGWWKNCEKASPYFSPTKSIKETDPFPQMYFSWILKWFKFIQNGLNLFDCINNSNTKGKQWQTNYTKWGLVLLLSLCIQYNCVKTIWAQTHVKTHIPTYTLDKCSMDKLPIVSKTVRWRTKLIWSLNLDW